METAEEILKNPKIVIQTFPETSFECYRKEAVLVAMREYAKQALEKASEVADADFNFIETGDDTPKVEVYVLKNSILDIIKELK